jgi:hypothetical protein
MHPDRLDDRRVRDAVDDLLVATRQPLLETFCFYDAYFLIEAAADARSAALARVQESTRRALVGTQVRSGPNRGSWDPTDRWSPVGGRIYTTALAALTLRVRAPRAAAWNG